MRIPAFRLLVVVVIVFSAVASATVTAESSQINLEETFEAIIARRQTIIDANPGMPERPINNAVFPTEFPYGDWLMDRVSWELAKEVIGPESAAYRGALISELSSSAPEYRSLACEFLRFVFDESAIRELGSLLGDSSPGAVMIRKDWTQQMETSREMRLKNMPWMKPTVAQVARASLYNLTRLTFKSRDVFENWWMANRDFKNRIWYWRSMWTQQPFELRLITDTAETRLPAEWSGLAALPRDLPKLDDASQLKMMLLYGNHAALQREADLALGPVPVNRPDDRVYAQMRTSLVKGAPDENSIAEFVRQNRFEPRLIELLCQKDLYPEVDGGAFFQLSELIAHVGRMVFTPEDEKAIAKAQSVTKPFEPDVQRLVLLRAAIAPDRAKSILVTALKSDLKMAGVARVLVAQFGSSEPRLVKQCFAAVDGWGQNKICGGVSDAVKAGVEVAPPFIGDLASMLPTPGESPHPAQESANSLAVLASVANTLTGTTIVTNEEFESIRYRFTKGDATDDMKVHNAAIPAAFKAVRKKLLAMR